MSTLTITQTQANFMSTILSSTDAFTELKVSRAVLDDDGIVENDGDVDNFDFHFSEAVGTYDAGVAMVASAITLTVDMLLHEILALVASIEQDPTRSGMVVRVPASL